jgi:hypothetical protein
LGPVLSVLVGLNQLLQEGGSVVLQGGGDRIQVSGQLDGEAFEIDVWGREGRRGDGREGGRKGGREGSREGGRKGRVPKVTKAYGFSMLRPMFRIPGGKDEGGSEEGREGGREKGAG